MCDFYFEIKIFRDELYYFLPLVNVLLQSPFNVVNMSFPASAMNLRTRMAAPGAGDGDGAGAVMGVGIVTGALCSSAKTLNISYFLVNPTTFLLIFIPPFSPSAQTEK